MLKVYPKAGVPVRDPGFRPVQGAVTRRVGMKLGENGELEPTGTPQEFDEGSQAGLEILRKLRRGELVPADAETAAAAGVQFVDLRVKDGWAVPAQKSAKAKE